MGRTAWFVTSLPAADYRLFVDDTVARGFNAIEFFVPTHDSRGNHPPFNGNGDIPFLRRLNGTGWNGALSYGNITSEAPDFTTPNEAYWSFVDGLLAYCESRGVLVVHVSRVRRLPGRQPGVDAGDDRERAVADADLRRLDRHAVQEPEESRVDDGRRHGSSFTAAQNNAEMGLFNGLKSVPGQQSTLFSAEWERRVDCDRSADVRPVDDAQRRLHVERARERLRTQARTDTRPVAPAFLLEEPYDEEGPDGNHVNVYATQPVRRFQWWGWLSTIGGYIAGNGYVWLFNSSPSWQEPPRYAGLARSRTAQRVHPVHPVVRPCALGHERHANPRQRKLRRRSE